MVERYSCEELLEHLVSFSEELGKSPTTEDLRETENRPSVTTYVRRFGSWNEAKRKAGLEIYEVPEKYSDEDLLDSIKALEQELGKSPSQEDIAQSDEYPDPMTYKTRFGTWNEAKRLAGVEIERQGGEISDEELLTDLKRVDELLDGKVTQDDYREEGRYSVPSYQRRFGTWNDAKAEAGLQIGGLGSEYTEEELLTHLTGLTEELGRTPIEQDIVDADGPSAVTYRKHFGSLKKARRKAGVEDV